MLWLLVTANVVSSSLILATLMMEVICSSKTSVLTRSTQHDIPDDSILHSHCRENLKSYKVLFCLLLCVLSAEFWEMKLDFKGLQAVTFNWNFLKMILHHSQWQVLYEQWFTTNKLVLAYNQIFFFLQLSP
jgi:hypothetical protein